MVPQTFTNGVGIGGGHTFTADVVIAADAADEDERGERNSVWFRYAVISWSVFIKNNVPDNQEEEAPPPEPEPETVIDIRPRGGTEERDRIVRVVNDRNLNGLRRLGGVDRVVSLQTSYFEEIGHEDIDNIQDLQGHLEASDQGKGFFYFLLKALNTYTIVLLLISAALLFAIEFIEQGPQHGWHDGVTVVFAILLLVSFSSVGQYRRQREMIKKNEKRKIMKIDVERNGRSLCIDFADVRVWDTVRLKEGDRIPGEGVFISGESLKLDEIHSSEIDRHRNPFLGFGSKVKEGQGSMIITQIGSDNASLSSKEDLLQCLMKKPYDYIEKNALIMSVLIAFIALIRLLFKKRDGFHDLPELKGNLTMKILFEIFGKIVLKPQGRVSIFVGALTAMVVGVQHGLPFAIGVCLSYWTDKLSDDQVRLRSISTCVTMGIASVAVVDVTHGDLLRKKSEIKEIWMGEKEILGNNRGSVARNNSTLRRGIDVWDYQVPDGIFATRELDSSEGSEEGSARVSREKSFRVIEYRRTSSSGKKDCEVLLRKNDEENSLHLYWKGPPMTILEMCSHFYDCSGEKLAIEDHQKIEIERIIKDMEKTGLNPIAFAYRRTEAIELKNDGLNLLAIIGLKYSCRADIKPLINALQQAGLSIKFVSEDELPALISVARETGFLQLDSNHTGAEFDFFRQQFTESGRSTDGIKLIANSKPENKFIIVEYLQGTGHVVAFVSGSARDTPTLRKADIGIVQQGNCTEIANESSDISIITSSPAISLAQIINCGRCLYLNIQRFLQLQFTTWVSYLTITLISTIFFGESPITSVQMLCVNLILCILGGFMMSMEFKPEPNQPAKRTRSILTKDAYINIGIQVCYQVCVLLFLQCLIVTTYASNRKAKNRLKALIFNTFAPCQIFNLLKNMKLSNKEVLAVVIRSWFFVALVTALFLQVMVDQFGNGILCSEKLDLKLWSLCVFLAALSILFDGAMKQVFSWLPDRYFSCSYYRSLLNLRRINL